MFTRREITNASAVIEIQISKSHLEGVAGDRSSVELLVVKFNGLSVGHSLRLKSGEEQVYGLCI